MDRICLFLITWTEYVLYCMWNCGHLTYFCYVFTMGVMARKVIFSHQNFHNPYEMLSLVLFPKGQLISKCLFGVSNSPKKGTWNSNFCPSLLGQKFFVRFLGELKKSKCPFEINWPLVGTSGTSLWLKLSNFVQK